MNERMYGIEIFAAGEPDNVFYVGTVESYEYDLDTAVVELAEQASEKGADLIYGMVPIMGYGCGSPNGPQDVIIQGWAATAAARAP